MGTLYDTKVMIRLIVLLGNKGLQYATTRHNAGWLFLAERYNSFSPGNWQEKFHGMWTKGLYAQTPLLLLKPMTFMNDSGRSVAAIARYFSVETEDILIVHDDIELPFRTVRLQKGGPLAGHNGLRSITSALGSNQLHRLRIGIGRPLHGTVSSYVLGRFDEFEQAEIPLVFDRAEKMLFTWFLQGCRAEELPITQKI